MVVLSVVILIGWWTDRSIQRNSEESFVLREKMAAAIFFRSQTAHDALGQAIANENSDYEIDLVRALIDLCKHEQLYDASSYSSYAGPAALQAKMILQRLNQDSKESFREFAITLYPFMLDAEQRVYRQKNNIILTGLTIPAEKQYPELYDTDSEEYKQLDDFISRALDLDAT